MENLDISDFKSVSSAADGDHVLMTLQDGSDGKMSIGLLKQEVGRGVTPSIKEGTWWVNGVDTRVPAEGKTPLFRKTATGIEMKYATDPESSWRTIIDLSDFKLDFDSLTEEQREQLVPTLDDFTPEEIARLKGERGEPFRYEDFTPEQIEALKRPAVEAAQSVGDAAQKAEEAAEEARNLPKIQDGTFWLYDIGSRRYVDSHSPATGRSPKIEEGTWRVWDDAAGAYTDTGVSVSSDYELTKGKVEAVLTGDINSHNHDAQLAEALQGYAKSDELDELAGSIPAKLSQLENDNHTVQDREYVHTDTTIRIWKD